MQANEQVIAMEDNAMIVNGFVAKRNGNESTPFCITSISHELSATRNVSIGDFLISLCGVTPSSFTNETLLHALQTPLYGKFVFKNRSFDTQQLEENAMQMNGFVAKRTGNSTSQFYITSITVELSAARNVAVNDSRVQVK